MDSHNSNKTSKRPSNLLPKPPWLRTKLYHDTVKVDTAIAKNQLETICQEASCPNRSECYHDGTATFLILGRVCSRKCTFCDVESGKPQPINPLEPELVASAVENLNLSYVVITSVNRDDLEDGGAAHFVNVIETLRRRRPGIKVEVLIPDLMGNWKALEHIVSAAPEVLNHNIETVESFYYFVRPDADYERSLELFRQTKKINPKMVTKSGIMLGMGESEDELKKVFHDLLDSGCDILTLGQYLQPSPQHLNVEEYVHPDKFAEYREYALNIGFKGVASGVFVRSSYQADVLYQQARENLLATRA